jgi:peptidyl-prolyl cis-trans isomerase A (cyclophilin A)
MHRHVALVSMLLLAACNTGPAEPTEGAQAAENAQTAAPPPPPPPTKAPEPPPPPPSAKPQGPADPQGGKWTLADATKDIKGAGPLVATLDTSNGKLACKLYDDKAPVTVANFVGLATGKRAWLDPASGQWVNKPAYDGTTFHRVIKDFMIQGGDPKGDGSGEPGYVIPDELWAGGAHDRAGLLCMANRGPNTNGAQFFITDSDGPNVKNLDRLHSYTIFGECSPVAVVHAIATVPTGPRDKPVAPVTIRSVKIARGTGK